MVRMGNVWYTNTLHHRSSPFRSPLQSLSRRSLYPHHAHCLSNHHASLLAHAQSMPAPGILLAFLSNFCACLHPHEQGRGYQAGEGGRNLGSLRVYPPHTPLPQIPPYQPGGISAHSLPYSPGTPLPQNLPNYKSVIPAIYSPHCLSASLFPL